MTENENLKKQITDDLSAVLKEAKSMGCKEVTCFRHIPLQNVETVIQALEENQWYKTIGTIEEFKALKEKSVAKKVIRPKGLLNEYYHEEECPHCKTEFRVHVVGYKYTQMVGETHHCPNCGQKLDWSE